ncbi:MAG: hypothetical protein IJT44_00980 [Clostridia bacterium]|nr:hypothetical protein [Clostridia bacterium]
MARNTARAFENVHYFDKDSLSAIAAAGASDASFDRSTDEFMQRFRDAEMDACVNLALEALEFNSHVIMSAPWRLELADLFANKSNARIRRLSEGCRHLNARLVLAFIDIDRDTVVEHLTKRQLVDPQAALRTRGIYEDPDKLQAFLKKQILHAPQGITRLPDVDEFFVFRASDPEGSFGQWKKVLSPVDYDFAFDPDF